MTIFKRILPLFVLCTLVLSLVPASAAVGNVTSFSGTYGTARIPRMTILPCAASAGNRVVYHLQPFYVTVAGSYTLETTSAFDDRYDLDTVLTLYQIAFDPANPGTNCIVNDDDGGANWLSLVSAPLQPGIQYFALVQAYLTSVTSGGYTATITGPGAAVLGMIPTATEQGPVIELPPDDRLNWRRGDMYATLYLRSDSAGDPVLHLYCVNETSEGYLGAVWGKDVLSLPETLPTVNTLVDSVDICKLPVNLYLLTSGEWALHIGPNRTGDVKALLWRGFPPANMTEVRFNAWR